VKTLSPVTLNRVVPSDDEAITDAVSKQLLINIAATFDFRFTAGATPALTGDAGRTILPVELLRTLIDEEPQYHVDKDSRTPEVVENPVKTIDLIVSSSAPSGLDLAMKSHGRYYAVYTSALTRAEAETSSNSYRSCFR
jgi:hypothetical protein